MGTDKANKRKVRKQRERRRLESGLLVEKSINGEILIKRTCEHCSEPFTPNRTTARFCSVRCRVYFHRDTQRNSRSKQRVMSTKPSRRAGSLYAVVSTESLRGKVLAYIAEHGPVTSAQVAGGCGSSILPHKCVRHYVSLLAKEKTKRHDDLERQIAVGAQSLVCQAISGLHQAGKIRHKGTRNNGTWEAVDSL